MPRALKTWLVALPLYAAGWLSAHALAYRLVAPHAAERQTLLAATGHAYLSVVPFLAAVAVAVLIVGLAVAVRDGRRGLAAKTPPARLLALLAPLGFAAQEHTERALAHGELPVAAALEPVFALGLLLQLPFALAALVLARLVHNAAAAIGRALASTCPRSAASLPACRGHGPSADLPRISPLALGYGQRAPPALLPIP